MISTQTGTDQVEPKEQPKPIKKKPAKKKALPKKSASTAKNANKNTRPPLGHETTPHKMTETQEIHQALNTNIRHDWEHYQRMPMYTNKKLFGVIETDVDRWINLGASPVEKRAKSVRVYPGLNDAPSSKYEFIVSGTDEFGRPTKTYLMAMDKGEYQRLRIAPQQAKNDAIRRSYGVGLLNNNGESVMPSVRGIQTYAPKTGDGNLGFSETTTNSEPRHDV